MMLRALRKKVTHVENLIHQEQRVMIALSGGVDSSVLLAIAHRILNEHVIAITVSAPIMPASEIKQARTIARIIGVQHIVTKTPLLQNKKLIANTRDRCYICKRLIFDQISKVAKRYRTTILEASNVDDTKDFRPGLLAIQQLGVLSPFIIARITKSEIRALAKCFKLPVWNKPSNACLATRIPYNIKITLKILKRIDQAETYLHNLGFSVVRVRDYSPIARIEISPNDFMRFIRHRTRIVRYFRRLGFTYPTLDLQGYKTGNLN